MSPPARTQAARPDEDRRAAHPRDIEEIAWRIWSGGTDRDALTGQYLARLGQLRDRGYFGQPTSSAEAVQELEDLGSPIGAFLRERCEVGPGLAVSCGLLFAHWKVCCEDQGRDHPGTVQSFSRDLRAAVPGVTTAQARVLGDERQRRHEGVGLRTDVPIGVTERAEAALKPKS